MDENLLKEAVRLYAGEAVLNDLSSEGALALERKLKKVEATILVIDIDPFTIATAPKNISNLQTAELLENYLDTISDKIINYGGFIGQINGDAIMAFWISENDSANKAVHCAIDCVKSSETISKIDGLTISARIGIASGEVFLGNIGSKSRLQYSILGQKVNLAWRLQVVNKQYQTKILICGNTENKIDKEISKQLVDTVVIAGTQEPLTLYKILMP